jgi:pathogenesis-related protein 1
MFRSLLLFLFISQQSTAQVKNTGSDIKSADATAILNHHNEVRKDKGVAALTWSPQLAAYAQLWADHLAKNNNCSIKHRGNAGENGKQYGENIFWGSDAMAYPPVQASYNWYGEKKDYTYRKINGSSWYNTGHYTQMIWKDTREMGVGVAVCANGAIIVVANYWPAGNVFGEFPY